MIRTVIFAATVIGLATVVVAVAQQPSPAQPDQRVLTAVATEIGQHRIDVIRLSVALETSQAVLATAQARIKQLEAKCEAPPAPSEKE